jgi:hypothetical protein
LEKLACGRFSDIGFVAGRERRGFRGLRHRDPPVCSVNCVRVAAFGTNQQHKEGDSTMRTLLLLAVLALAAGAAEADNGMFYVGAGIARNKISNIAITNSDLDSTSWKAFVGVRPMKVFAVEADYIDLGSETSQFVDVSTHVQYKAFAGYAVGFLPLPLPMVDVFGKVGLARWQQSGSSNASPGSQLFSLSDDGTEFAWGVGAQAHFGSIGARLEYENFNIHNTDGAGVVSLSVFLNL